MTRHRWAALFAAAALSAAWARPALAQISSRQGTATLQGIVVDAGTEAPLAGARVWLVDLSLTAFTGADGRFEFRGIPGGTFTITVSEIGYAFVKRRVDLADAAMLGVVIPMAAGQSAYTEEVTVSAEVERAPRPGVVAETVVGPGGLQSLRSVAADDPMRAVQALPGVATGDDFRSEFSVRGAPFRQVATIIDGIATPLLVHTVKGRGDTGSVAMINTDVLESATVTAGAAPQTDGSWIGGSLKFSVREGSRDRTSLRVAASDTGAAFVVEGPLGRSRKGSWLFSMRKSYADWLIRKLDPTFGSTLGFYDLQSKWTYDVTSRQQVQALVIGGDAHYFQANSGPTNGLRDANTRSAVASVAWLYRRPSLQITQRVSTAYSDFENLGAFGQNQGDGVTRGTFWRGDVSAPMGAPITVDGGWSIQQEHDARSLRLYAGNTAATLRVTQSRRLVADRRLSAAWGQVSVKGARGAFVAGVRAQPDGGTSSASPWLLGEWRPASRLAIKAGAARPVQHPDLYLTAAAGRDGTAGPERANAFDAGVSLSLGAGWTARVNGYAREDFDGIRGYGLDTVSIGAVIFGPSLDVTYLNALRARSRGIETVLERKGATGLAGWFSYAYGRTRVDDQRMGEQFDGDFDQRHTINVVLEQRLSYRTAINMKIRAGSSAPIVGYFDGTADDLRLGTSRNTVRLPPYFRLDVRANRTYTFNRRRLTLFLEVINATGRRNLGPAEGFVRSDRRAVNYTEKLIPWLPSIGVLIEF
jgi:hypothetical protein